MNTNEPSFPVGTKENGNETQTSTAPEKKRHGKQQPFRIGSVRCIRLGDRRYALERDLPFSEVGIDHSAIRAASRTIKLSDLSCAEFGIPTDKKCVSVTDFDALREPLMSLNRTLALHDEDETDGIKEQELCDAASLYWNVCTLSSYSEYENAFAAMLYMCRSTKASSRASNALFGIENAETTAEDTSDNTAEALAMSESLRDAKMLGPAISMRLMLIVSRLCVVFRKDRDLFYDAMASVMNAYATATKPVRYACGPRDGLSVQTAWCFMDGTTADMYKVCLCLSPNGKLPPHIHVCPVQKEPDDDATEDCCGARYSLADGGIIDTDKHVQNSALVALHNGMHSFRNGTSHTGYASGYGICLSMLDPNQKKAIARLQGKTDVSCITVPEFFPPHTARM